MEAKFSTFLCQESLKICSSCLLRFFQLDFMWNAYFCAILTATTGNIIRNFRMKGKEEKPVEFELSFSHQKDTENLELSKSIKNVQNKW